MLENQTRPTREASYNENIITVEIALNENNFDWECTNLIDCLQCLYDLRIAYHIEAYFQDQAILKSAYKYDNYLQELRVLEAEYKVAEFSQKLFKIGERYNIGEYYQRCYALDSDYKPREYTIKSIELSFQLPSNYTEYQLKRWRQAQIDLKSEYKVTEYKQKKSELNSEYKFAEYQNEIGSLDSDYKQGNFRGYREGLRNEYNYDEYRQKRHRLVSIYRFNEYRQKCTRLETKIYPALLQRLGDFMHNFANCDKNRPITVIIDEMHQVLMTSQSEPDADAVLR